ncbi:MAG: T9SS type A sorting domain-containing protein [Flavobacteriales bacterium]|nr:T9SS type A sorting domain-containing protein [Flavobacteriales bacterium]
MTRSHTLLLASVLAHATSAQVLDQSQAVPPYGAYSHDRFVGDAFGSTLDTVGTGLTWNISAIAWTADDPVTYAVMDAGSSAFAGLAPTASTCLVESTPGQGDLHWFYRNTTTELESVGVVLDFPGFPATLEPDCPGLLLTYPAPLGTTVLPGLAGCGMDIDAVERKVLASGTLQTPAGSYPGMVLIRTTLCGLDPFGKGETICDHRYEWYKLGNLLKPLLTIYRLDQDWNMAILLIPTGFTGTQEITLTTSLTVHPNPAADQLIVQHSKSLPLGEVALHALDGRLLLSEQSNTDRLVLDVQDLAPGLYSVACMLNGKRTMVRFVKE